MLKTVGNPSTRYGNQTITDGNLVIGTSGKGIDFSATSQASGMTSELLNDYEEGNWTPAIVSSGGGAATYVRQIGTYTKIGNRVLIQCEIDLATKGTLAAGDLSISGLPYTSNSTVANWSALNLGLCDGFTFPVGALQLEGVVNYNSVSCYLYWMKSALATVNTTIADISSTVRLNFSAQYSI